MERASLYQAPPTPVSVMMVTMAIDVKRDWMSVRLQDVEMDQRV